MDWKLWSGSDADWDAGISVFSHASFTQSSAWAEFQRTLGREVVRLSDGVGFCQLVLVKKTVGSYWLAQRGPVGGDMHVFIIQAPSLLPKGAWFIRIEPVLGSNSDQGVPSVLIRKKSHDPSVTRVLDLSKNESDLLADMHHKTRYNIRVAEKHGVEVFESDSIEEFLALQKDTASRDGFAPQSDTYIRRQFETLGARGLVTVLVAQKNGQPLAANFMIGFGDTATYLYGASSSEHRNIMSPFMLHWEAIKWAKKKGYRWYDFWGCNPESPAHPDFKPDWEGITRFKAGWGGQSLEYPGTYDIPLRPALYQASQKLLLGRLQMRFRT